jgi:hypothetical protein
MDTLPPPLLSPRDVEHLKLLAIFHYIVGGIGAFFACFPLIHVFLGVMMVANPESMGGNAGGVPPPFVGFLFAGMGLLFVLIGWAGALLTIISGRMLAKRRRRIFSFVVAVILCMFFPFGTALGVFTIIVLSRDSVRRLYGEAA